MLIIGKYAVFELFCPYVNMLVMVMSVVPQHMLHIWSQRKHQLSAIKVDKSMIQCVYVSTC